MKKLFIVLLLMSIFCANYAQKHDGNTYTISKKRIENKSSVKYGVASFYARKFQGRQTADGEIYDASKFTAACNVLPLHTWIKVTNIVDSENVIVKINDRMRKRNKRLIDLSNAAAKKLGYHGRGLIKVKIEVLPDYHS
jgi:rare lipoprotein A